MDIITDRFNCCYDNYTLASKFWTVVYTARKMNIIPNNHLIDVQDNYR